MIGEIFVSILDALSGGAISNNAIKTRNKEIDSEIEAVDKINQNLERAKE